MDIMRGKDMKQMLARHVLILPSLLMLGLISGCAPVDSSYNQDPPPGPPVWPLPGVYETPRQYGGAPFLDLGYDHQARGAAESGPSSTNGPSGPEPRGSSTAAAEGDNR